MATLIPFDRRKTERESATDDTSLAALCARASHDERAQSEIFVREKRAVARTIAAILGPEPEGEDLVHETFLRAFDRIHDLESPAKLPAWLRGIAVFVAREWLKKRARRRWTFFDIFPDFEAPAADEGVRDALRDTFRVLERMPVDERLAMSLRYIDGLEIDDLAVALDLSVSTAKRRLRDAERRFRALAAKHPGLSHLASDAPEAQ